MSLKEMGREKKKKHGKLIKCDVCKKKMDLDEEKELGNVSEEHGINVLWCECGNEIVIK